MRHNGPVPATPSHNVRVDRALWQAAQAKAAKRRESVSDVVRRALVDYVGDDLPDPDDD